jgi:hypothetical protein
MELGHSNKNIQHTTKDSAKAALPIRVCTANLHQLKFATYRKTGVKAITQAILFLFLFLFIAIFIKV